MDRVLNILFIEASEQEAAPIGALLERRGVRSDHTVAATERDMLTALTGKSYDVVLCGDQVPAFPPEQVLASLRAHAPDLPVIVISGPLGEEQAADLIGSGARDIIPKAHLNRLAPTIEREIAARAAHARLTERADQSQRHFSNLAEQSIQGIIVRADRTTLFVNDAMCRMFGYSHEEMAAVSSLLDLLHDDDRARVKYYLDFRSAGSPQRFEARGRRKDGSIFWIETMVSSVVWFETMAAQFVVIDISERKAAEEGLLAREKKYREIFESAPVAMFRSNENRKFMEVNPALEDLLGYHRTELLAAGPGDFMFKDELREVARATARLWNGEAERVTVQHRMKRKDGGLIWVTSSSCLTVEDDGTRYLLAHLQDITELKGIEQALSMGERQYRETFENAPVAMAWVSLEGYYIRTNRAFQDVFGYTAEELLRMKPSETVHPKFKAADAEGMADLMSGKAHHIVIENQHVRKDGRPIWLLNNVVMIRNADGSPRYMLGHFQDITARKSAEDQLFQMQKMEALGNFAGGIAHDFNNMLLPIISLTDMVKSDLPEDSPFQEDLAMVLDAANKARNLVQQILTFSRQSQTKAAVIDISKCAAEGLNLLRNVLPATIKVTGAIQPEVGTVLADVAQLQSVIMNLGSNAADAIGGRVGELRVGLERVVVEDDRAASVPGLAPGGAYAKLVVADTGSGMDAATLEKIFNPFFTTKAPGQGTGLGLSMVHGIVERSGGTIDVMSEPGVGTTFDIYLPLVPNDTAERPIFGPAVRRNP